jgi:geranylgeranyl pyrophosphate synthase
MQSMIDLASIYKPVEADLAAVGDLLEHELISGDPFVGELVRHVLATPGKMVRPALVCLAAQAGGGAGEARLWVAGAVELIHVASLIHDDIIDASDVRRGAATINAQWGNQIAVLLGDYLFAKAFDLLSRVRDHDVSLAMAAASVEMSQAEILQIKYGSEPHDQEDLYFRIIRGKTAHLFSAACRAGGLVAGNAAAAHALGTYGLEWGMAFQITDDALDLTSREEELGKPIHSDIRGGKMTLPMIRALRAASPDDRSRLFALVGSTPWAGHTDEVAHLLARYRAVEYALDVAGRFSKRAADALRTIPDGAAKDSLLRLTEFVVARSR